MQIDNATRQAASRFGAGLRSGLLGTLLTLMAGAAAGQTVSQSPLSIAGDVPGNLLLVPSVEWPTLDSMANLGDYSTARTYTGYFDAGKCYAYSFSANEPDRHFYPVRTTSNRICSTAPQWSGNYLNWAATQTIDPFRKALTGGYRVRDTQTETWLEKARYDGNGGGDNIYPDRRIPAASTNATLVAGATPANWGFLTVRIKQLGNRMRFTTGTGNLDSAPTAYNPNVSLVAGTVYEVSVRVKVCDPSLLESNCRRYSQGWKPEGLIQRYSERIRYSVFGYLNDGSVQRDGGVLRAKQKFVGENMLDPVTATLVANTNAREWNPTTGVLIRNPDAADATATTSAVGRSIDDSGVINYINKFGQMTTQNHKSFDPVSDLYYAAIRYLKNQGNVSAYTSLTGTSTQKFNFADGFPVITDWDDPIQYRCQANAILGIGDVNTWYDKNLPGNVVTTDEPTAPSDNSTLNVVTATAKVEQLEGITLATPFNTGRQSSAYIAGLAYDSHTVDLRPAEGDFAGMQTVSTHWVDVREAGILRPRAQNQYWLAAKYGGFTVPQGFAPYADTTVAIDASSWNSGETLSTGDPRPKNFYVASEADKMVESLTRAFANIAAPSTGSATSLASNSTRLDDDTKTFQAQFVSGTWSGELNAFQVADDGSLVNPPLWQAGPLLTAAAWANRRIYVQGRNGSYGLFTWANLSTDQQTALDSGAVVDYLRGNRSNEESQANQSLRTRTSVLGDIVNSTPIYVGAPNARLHVGATFTGASSYGTFAGAQRSRAPVVYVGANDGMLHGFNADTGAETYAFVPNAAIFNGLAEYSDPGYGHRYFVDGEIAVSDVYDTSLNPSRWRTVLVGTLGRGGPGVFALDVTDPANVAFLWEKRGADIAALGQNIGKPVIAQVANGDWRVVIGNGTGTTSGSAQLITIRIGNGAVSVADTGAAGANGLMAAMARDSDGDGFSDDAYAGDLLGNLWKFTGLSGTPSVTKLYEARDPSGNEQPITVAPQVSKDPATGMIWVFFGTGQYLSRNDLSNKQVQTWYGLNDTGSLIGGRNDLVERNILAEAPRGDFTVRVIDEGAVNEFADKDGWFMDLMSPNANSPEGERMVVPNRLQGTALIGTTRIPDASDPCRPGGRGFIMAINPFTGARLDETFFDLNGDGEFDQADMLLVDGVWTIVSGIGPGEGEGSPNGPIFVEDVMQYSLDDGTTKVVKTQGSAVDASRMSWRELLN